MDPTIEDCFFATRNIDGKNVRIELIDRTGDCEAYEAQQALEQQAACDGFFLMIDVTNKESCEQLIAMKKNLLEQRLKMKLSTKELAIVVMANKCDLNHTTTEHDLKQGIWNFVVLRF